MTKDRPTGIVSTPTYRFRHTSGLRAFNSQFILAAIVGVGVLAGFLAGFYARGFWVAEPVALADMSAADVRRDLPQIAVVGTFSTPQPSAKKSVAGSTQAQTDDLPLSFYTLLPNDRMVPERPSQSVNPEPRFAVPEAVQPNLEAAALDVQLKVADGLLALSDSPTAQPRGAVVINATAEAAHREVAYVLQVGSFSGDLHAEKRKNVLLLMGFHAVYTEPYTDLQGQVAYRVMLGPFAHQGDVRSIQSRLQAARMDNFMRVIRHEAGG